MILGLKGASVELVDHDPAWGTLAAQDIEELWNIFGLTAKDIQHVGSIAIHGIKAKPIIDIAIGVQNFEDIPPQMQIVNGAIGRVDFADGKATVWQVAYEL